MKTLLFVLTMLLIWVLGAYAQSNTVGTTDEPQYSASFGLGFNGYTSPRFTGWAGFDTRIASATYNVNVLNMTSKGATITEELKRNFYANGTVTLFGVGGAGVATGSDSTTATFLGGGGFKLLLAKVPFLRVFGNAPGTYVTGVLKAQQINGAGVSPTFSAGLGYDFK